MNTPNGQKNVNKRKKYRGNFMFRALFESKRYEFLEIFSENWNNDNVELRRKLKKKINIYKEKRYPVVLSLLIFVKPPQIFLSKTTN